MVNATINGIAISVEDGTTILEAARKVGVEIPTLCYLKEVNEIGACRIQQVWWQLGNTRFLVFPF